MSAEEIEKLLVQIRHLEKSKVFFETECARYIDECKVLKECVYEFARMLHRDAANKENGLSWRQCSRIALAELSSTMSRYRVGFCEDKRWPEGDGVL